MIPEFFSSLWVAKELLVGGFLLARAASGSDPCRHDRLRTGDCGVGFEMLRHFVGWRESRARAPAPHLNKKPPGGREAFSETTQCCSASYFGCCWVSVLMGAALLLESCSRSFFSRLISTRPPEMRFVFAVSSLEGSGALPMPTR